MIITIGRQYGSGGSEIGKKLAQRLGYTFYDKEILTIAAEENGFSAAAMEHYDEKPSGSLIYSLYMTGAATADTLPLNQQLAFAQFNVIRKVAQSDNCVIVGRCADYILREKENLLTVYLHAPMEDRAKRIMAEKNIDSIALAEKTVKKTDKFREEYYNFFTHKKWGSANCANLALDTSVLGIDRCVEIIAGAVELMEE